MVITEGGSASKYADFFGFDVLELDAYDPLRLIELIEQAAAENYRVLCVDSLSHFRMGKDGELEKVDRAAQKMKTPTRFAAWKQVTPIHNALVDKIIGAPPHVLVSMRAKTEWILDRDDRTGKTVPRKVGLAPVMRDGIEYEFDACGDMDHESTLQITKSRCPKLAGQVFQSQGKHLADVLKEWLEGTPADQTDPKLSQNVPSLLFAPKKDHGVNGTGNGMVQVARIPKKPGSIVRRMCSPRGVVKELEDLKKGMEELAGSMGAAEDERILRQHGVEGPKEFRTTQPTRLCDKDLFQLLAGARSVRRGVRVLPTFLLLHLQICWRGAKHGGRADSRSSELHALRTGRYAQDLVNSGTPARRGRGRWHVG